MPASRPLPPSVAILALLLAAIVVAERAPTLRLQGAELRNTAAVRRPTLVVADDAEVRNPADAAATAGRIDRLFVEHWRTKHIQPTARVDDAEFLRRVTLDLTGRVPTLAEQDRFLQDPAAERRTAVIERLLAGPEFALHLARVLDDWIQRTQNGDEAFVDWLRASLAAQRSWQQIFRSVLVGPWLNAAEKPANKFLVKRGKSIDSLTADTGRAFFGVDITCARCHDHPLVDDWKQDHYYGLAAFFHRTQVSGKNSDAKVEEKKEGELTFEARPAGQKTAVPLYLTERKVDSAAKGSRREQLVAVALEERSRFSRAAANRMWAWFFGRGLVEPVDQMHSANPPSVPGVLELLADDFATHDYDLKHLVRSIVLTDAYQLSSRQTDNQASLPADPGDFAAASLRPLTPRQFALSLVLATGDDAFAATTSDTDRIAAYRAAEKQAAELPAMLDSTVDGYRPGVGEALFLSNNPLVQKRCLPEGDNLAARLSGMKRSDARLDLAFRTLLGRVPTANEREALTSVPPADLIWILMTSVEFRFNH